MERSNSSHVFLSSTDLNSEGLYGCEVSSEAPSFSTAKSEDEMRIYGELSVHVNCILKYSQIFKHKDHSLSNYCTKILIERLFTFLWNNDQEFYLKLHIKKDIALNWIVKVQQNQMKPAKYTEI